MSNEKKRAFIESQYEEVNKSDQSVCSGKFYIKNRKVWETCAKCDKCDKYKYYQYKDENTKEVVYCYINSFRNCDLYKIDFINGSYIARTTLYSVLYANDVAINMVKLIGSYLPKEDKQAKKIYDGSIKRVKAYENMMNDIMKNKIYDWADFNSRMDEVVEPMIDELFNSCKRLFDEKHHEYSNFYTACQVAGTLCDFAVQFLSKRIANCLKFKINAVNLRQYYLTDLRKNIFGLCEWTSRKYRDVVLNTDETLNAFRKYNMFMIDYREINKLIRETVEVKE